VEPFDGVRTRAVADRPEFFKDLIDPTLGGEFIPSIVLVSTLSGREMITALLKT